MKKIFVVLLAALMLAIGANAAFEKVNTYNNDFSDVKESNWFYGNVKSAYELGFMNGKSEGKFDPNGNVTVAEGITMAARLHAIYNGTEVTEKKADVEEYRIEFDSMKDISIRTNTTIGSVKDGVLVLEAKGPNANGGYDLGAIINGLDLDTRDYNKIVVRMKREIRPNINDNFREDRLEIFYTTSTSNQFAMDKYLPVALYKKPADEWIDVEINVTNDKSPLWKDYITAIRIDPSNDNGVYYIDYIAFSKGETKVEKKWYEMYVDYAVENGIVDRGTYVSSTYNKNISRAELCDLFAAALPEEYYAPINEVKGIPDVPRDAKNSDVYLMLYKAGVLLGSDAKGTFNPKSDIKRSEVAAIINRAALPENRVKGTIDFDWAKQGNEYDLEFNSEEDLSRVTFDAESVKVEDGNLVLVPKFRGPNASPQYDPKVVMENVSIDASKFTKLKVRLKPIFDEEIQNTTFEFFFMTADDADFAPAKMAFADLLKVTPKDPAGWYIIEVDLATRSTWNGTITAFRFDPLNTGGTFLIDYIRLAKADYLDGASHETLLAEGYTAKKYIKDEGFERGFYVTHFEQKKVDKEQRKWQDYCATQESPLWSIGALWTTVDLFDNRDTSKGANVLADTSGISEVAYNAEEDSLKLHLDATKIYKGAPHTSATITWWPHLLIEQLAPTENREPNFGVNDRIFAEADIKLSDFKDTTNTEGVNACQFLAYYYLFTDKAPGQRVWFGINLFDDRNGGKTSLSPYWQTDGAARMYIYGTPEAVVFDGIENSLTPERDTFVTGDEWKHVRVDVTSHIDRVVEWANRDKIFGADVEIAKEDFYFGGANIGFEIHGNFDATFEIKNFNLVSYSK